MDIDVPFISSGAQSRAHYALVRRVETALSPQQADQYLLAEVKSIRNRIGQAGQSLKSCKEFLVILLYCSMAMTAGILAQDDLDFALPYSVNLAEAGNATSDKRIGYLFCAEIMPRNHELQLMLINTLRKDLENSSIPRICLALDILVHSSTKDVIPAIQSRLHDLLSHNSPHVRRRALLAFHALSVHDPDLMKRVTAKVRKRLKDPDPSVVSAALVVSADMSQGTEANVIRRAVNDCIRAAWETRSDRAKPRFLLKVTRTLHTVKLSGENLRLLLDIVKYASNPTSPALLFGSFRLLSDFSSDTITTHQSSSGLGPVNELRRLLTSDPNEQYLFLACLNCLKPDLWAGTSLDRPAILEGWEVERVMKLLDSADRLIRKMTLNVLHRVDTGIVGSYFAQSLQSIPSTLSVNDKNEYTVRLLEIVEIQCGEDGEFYAQQLKDLCAAVERDSAPEHQPMLESVIENVLPYIKNASPAFRMGCATTLIAPVVEANSCFSSTLMVIVSAIASEYSGKLSIPPVDILRGLASRLASYTASVQDAGLLSMLRVAADCDEVPPEVLILVKDLAQYSRKHIRQRCKQFVTLCGQRHLLVEITSRARSPSLPDFLEALLIQTSPSPQSDMSLLKSPPHSPGRSSSQMSSPTRKLRYAAYEPPQAVPRLQRPSSSQRSYSSSSGSVNEDGSLLDELSRTVTAGDLALAGGIELELMAKTAPNDDELASRVDLIAFDSPFISDPPDTSSETASTEPDFEGTWNTQQNSNARGWCEVSTDVIIRRLQGLRHHLTLIAMDQPPFEGDLKILVSSGSNFAALRLRESDDESCLWRLRCGNNELRTTIERLLRDA